MIKIGFFSLLFVFGLVACDEQTQVIYKCANKDNPQPVKDECLHKRDFTRPKIDSDNCFYQESRGDVIKTCG